MEEVGMQSEDCAVKQFGVKWMNFTRTSCWSKHIQYIIIIIIYWLSIWNVKKNLLLTELQALLQFLQVKCLQGWKFFSLFPNWNFWVTFKVDLLGKINKASKPSSNLILPDYFTGAAGVNISYTRCISSILLNVNNDWWDGEGGEAALLARVRLIWSTIRLIASLIMLSATVQFGLHLSLNGCISGL